MFGCLPLDGPHREGGLLAALRTYLPLSRTTLTQQLFCPRPEFRRPCPAASPILRVIVACGSWKMVSSGAGPGGLPIAPHTVVEVLHCADRSYRRWRWLWPEEGIWLEAAFTFGRGMSRRRMRRLSLASDYLQLTDQRLDVLWREAGNWPIAPGPDQIIAHLTRIGLTAPLLRARPTAMHASAEPRAFLANRQDCTPRQVICSGSRYQSRASIFRRPFAKRLHTCQPSPVGCRP
jgi:hypothetical protein